MTHRVKFDINNWARQVYEILDNSKSKIVLENRAGISMGLNLLMSYLIKIAERAIELNDDKLIELLVDVGVLSKEE